MMGALRVKPEIMVEVSAPFRPGKADSEAAS
jgi:hypothetical protein